MKLEISHIGPVFDGVSFGGVGPYEKVTGHLRGEVDPGHSLNAGIVNLDKAPRNRAGKVEYQVEFCLLKPADMRRHNGRILYDVLNRGNKLAMNAFNDAPARNDLDGAADAGNGFLMRQGFAVLWSAWQGDVAAGEGRMLASFPVASDNGAPIVTRNRDEFIFNHTQNPALAPLSYPAHNLDPAQASLTVRQRESDPRVALPGTQWKYRSERSIEIVRPAEFDAGAIYEFIYPARDPIVMGLGFAAMRDVVAFFRRQAADDEGRPNPLSLDGSGPSVASVFAFGASQSGRFLRDYLWQGFNQDMEGRIVFDGVMPSLAGARKTFTNFAFAQPGRFSCQHEDHLTPGEQFPFTYAMRRDSISGRTDGILERYRESNTRAKVMHIDSSGEYWQGRASLVVTDEAGHKLKVLDEVRIYLFSGTQHGGRLASNFFTFSSYTGNPVEMNPGYRALLMALDQWVNSGVAPPASRYPSTADGTLVAALPQHSQGFPAIPGVSYTGLVNQLSEVDYGSQPPKAIAGHDYVVLVPKVDADGNEIAGVKLPDVAAPMGTYTGWNPRRAGFAEGESSLLGSYIPFAATAADRQASGDPRPSLQERYENHDAYVNAIAGAARELQESRLLLAEDVERYIEAATRRRKHFPPR